MLLVFGGRAYINFLMHDTSIIVVEDSVGNVAKTSTEIMCKMKEWCE